MSRQIRPVTVVSQPARFATSSVSALLSRSQASWTASSALGQRAQHPVRYRAQVPPLLLEPLGQQLLISHCHILPSPSSATVTNRPAWR
jgi:hypothetical protein